MNKIRPHYLSALFHSLEEKKYCISLSTGTREIYIKSAKTIKKENNFLNNLFKIQDLNSFLKACKDKNPYMHALDKPDTFLDDFYIKYLLENKSLTSSILNNYHNLTNKNLINNYEKIFPHIFKDNNEFINTVKQLDTKSFTLPREHLKEFLSFVKTWGLNPEETKEIFFNYFSMQKNNFTPERANFYKEFLLNNWRNDTTYLERFFDIMPFLKDSILRQHELFNHSHQYTFVSTIDYNKLFYNHFIDGYTKDNYSSSIEVFCKTYAKTLAANHVSLYSDSKQLKIIVESNSHINKEIFEKHVSLFLNNLNYNNSKYFLEPSNVEKWLLKQKLEHSLTLSSKQKIVKI